MIISAAIGGTLAAAAGADFLCYVTPAEHLALPTIDDVREGVMASRIAAHAADIVKGVPGAKKSGISRWRKPVGAGLGRPDFVGFGSKARRYRQEKRRQHDLLDVRRLLRHEDCQRAFGKTGRFLLKKAVRSPYPGICL